MIGLGHLIDFITDSRDLIAAAVIITLIAIIIRGTFKMNSLKELAARLAEGIAMLKNENANLRAERDAAVTKIADLEAQLAELPGIEAALQGLVAQLPAPAQPVEQPEEVAA